MITTAHVYHRVPGRMRLRIPKRQGDVAFFTRVARELSQAAGVTRVECNARTASVLVTYATGVESGFLDLARQRELFELAGTDGKPATLVERAGSGLQMLDGQLRRITHGDVDVRSVILGGFVTMGVMQLYRGHIMGPAVTLFWYAYQLMAKSGSADKQ